MNSYLRYSVVISAILLLFAAFVAWKIQPSVYAEKFTPNGKMLAQIIQVPIFPYIEGIDVYLRISNQNTVIYYERFGSVDLPVDIHERFSDFRCTNQDIKIGPKYLKDNKEGYFSVEFKDLQF